jgi:hypothetical protein
MEHYANAFTLTSEHWFRIIQPEDKKGPALPYRRF